MFPKITEGFMEYFRIFRKKFTLKDGKERIVQVINRADTSRVAV